MIFKLALYRNGDLYFCPNEAGNERGEGKSDWDLVSYYLPEEGCVVSATMKRLGDKGCKVLLSQQKSGSVLMLLPVSRRMWASSQPCHTPAVCIQVSTVTGWNDVAPVHLLPQRPRFIYLFTYRVQNKQCPFFITKSFITKS